MHAVMHACITAMSGVYELSLSCIGCMFFFSGFLEQAFVCEFLEQAICLRPVQATQVHDICPFYNTVLIDIVEHHLFLLDGRKSGLPDIFRFLSCLTVQGGAEGISPAPAGAVRFEKTGLDKFFQGGPNIGLRFLDGWSKIGGSQSAFFTQAG